MAVYLMLLLFIIAYILITTLIHSTHIYGWMTHKYVMVTTMKWLFTMVGLEDYYMVVLLLLASITFWWYFFRVGFELGEPHLRSDEFNLILFLTLLLLFLAITTSISCGGIYLCYGFM